MRRINVSSQLFSEKVESDESLYVEIIKRCPSYITIIMDFLETHVCGDL